MSLKDLTKEAHSNAERQEFVKILFSGNIDSKLYATYLRNQFFMYDALERAAASHGLLITLPDVHRADKIDQDFLELWTDRQEDAHLCPVVQDYIDYIGEIRNEPDRLMAHMYVRHMGDLAGGQMIAKRVPGSGKYYEFADPESLKIAIRQKINDNMAEEAKVCFEFATRFFQEMMDIVNEQQN